MKSRNVAWTLVGCTVAATSTGLFVPEPSLAVGSVVLGGCALANFKPSALFLERIAMSP